MGKSYRELGFWSNGLGFSESINENAIYSSSMKELGQVFWPGGPWYTPRGWTLTTENWGTCRIHIQTVCVKVEYDQSENNTSYTGFAINVFKATVERLPFHLPYNFFPFNGTYNALVEQIHLKVRVYEINLHLDYNLNL